MGIHPHPFIHPLLYTSLVCNVYYIEDVWTEEKKKPHRFSNLGLVFTQ